MKSMTGYGAGEAILHGKKISVEIKSVNSRYSDISVKTPRFYSFLEAPLKKRAAVYASRGKIDIFVNIDSGMDETKGVEVNVELAKKYLAAIVKIAAATGMEGEISAAEIAGMPDVLTVNEEEDDAEELTESVLAAFDKAGEEYVKMRAEEGKNIKEELISHLDAIERTVLIIEENTPKIVEAYRERLEARMREILENVPYDETRLLTEVAIFSDKVNVDEELARLKSHISQMRNMFEAEEPTGKKMDFLIQEMNREINTTGSKCSNLSVARSVIDVKAEIEKLREQVQNIE